MENTTDSQKKRILRYLLNGYSLTPIDALNLFGCFRLGARIWELRNEGYPVKMRLIEHNGKRFAEDYDIQDNFGETDNKIDLFHEIEEGYNGRPSVFDTIVGGGRRRPYNGVFSVYLFLPKFYDAFSFV